MHFWDWGMKTQEKDHAVSLAAAAKSLPAGSYEILNPEAVENLEIETLGWLMNNYIFDKYKNKKDSQAYLVKPKTINSKRILQFAEAEAFARDLINTPTSDMGPEDLALATRNLWLINLMPTIQKLLEKNLIAKNFPLIHSVGRASSQEPRLIEIKSGNKGPKVTLVGKGVCFDTGGLNIKPGRSMGLMKKDMGGAANVLALASMILINRYEYSINGYLYQP